MAKVHVSLVGGQPTPIYQGILYQAPDKVFLLHSKTTHEDAENIKEYVSPIQCQLFEISENNLLEMQQQLELVFSMCQDDDVMVNMSGGLKVWVATLSRILAVNYPQINIINLGQDGKIFSQLNPQLVDVVNFDMDKQFELLGQRNNIEWTTLSQYDDDDKLVCEEIKEMYWEDKRIIGMMNQFSQEILKKQKDRPFDYETTSDHTTIFNQDCDNWVKWESRTGTFDVRWKGIPYILDSTHVDELLLNTGWFEYDVAKCFAEIYGEDKVHLNTIFKSENQKDKNEIDIIVEMGQRLLFVECKTKILDGKTNAINKFANVVKCYGGLGTKSLFITQSEMTPEQKEKCRDSAIPYFTFYDKQHRVKKDELKKICDEFTHSWNIK